MRDVSGCIGTLECIRLGFNFVFLSLNLGVSAFPCLVQILTMFVLLIRMINDPKSAQFITWTELGTSFVVSNVGEFSRSILGSHFKHNNVRFAPMDCVLWLTGLSLFSSRALYDNSICMGSTRSTG